MKFRKKPVVIEAVQYRGIGHRSDFPAWFDLALANGKIQQYRDYASIQTLEGIMRVDIGDWIIRGVKGELYPCKPDIFAATYEPVEEPAAPEKENR